MKRMILTAIVMAIFFLGVHPGHAGDGSGVGAYGSAASEGAMSAVKGDLADTMNSARKAYDAASLKTYDEMIPKPEDIQDQASGCLDGIMNADFGFGLNVPSVSNLMGQACDKISSKVKGHLQKASSQTSADAMNGLIESEMGMGMAGDNAPPSRVNYEEKGKQISDQLWQDVKQEKSWLK